MTHANLEKLDVNSGTILVNSGRLDLIWSHGNKNLNKNMNCYI